MAYSCRLSTGARRQISGVSMLCAALTLIGCSSTSSKPILTAQERTLGVESELSEQFHSLLYFPKGYALHYPGYVLALQKAPREQVNLSKGKLPGFLQHARYFDAQHPRQGINLGTKETLARIANDPKVMFVSHVARFAPTLQAAYPQLDSCLLYNAFQSPEVQRRIQLSPDDAIKRDAWLDPQGGLAWNACSQALAWGHGTGQLPPDEFVANGEPVVNGLAQQVAHDLRTQRYSHVLVIIMGWHTQQDEAMRNFNDIAGNLVQAGQESAKARRANCGSGCMPFRPLVIGITWPSRWATPLGDVFSYLNKTADADEVGAGWVNLLVNQALPRAMAAQGVADVPIVMVGHSLGARAISSAIAMSPALKPAPGQPEHEGLHSPVRLAVLLQGAFSMNRFAPDDQSSWEGAPLRDFQLLPNTRFVLTASQADKATGGRLGPDWWTQMTGSMQSYQQACHAGAERDAASSWHGQAFHCLTASDNSGREQPLSGSAPWSGFRLCDNENNQSCQGMGGRWVFADRRVLYVDASQGVIHYNSLGSGGNGHSDIYRISTGRLLWTLIDALAPAPR